MASSLEHYIQEAVAWALNAQLSEDLKCEIAVRAGAFWQLVQAALQELRSEVSQGNKLDTEMMSGKQPFRARRVLAYQAQLREFRETLAADYRDNLS